MDFGSVPINSTSPGAAPHRAVLTNCRCLGEGIDVPSTDSILFADSKQSSLDITQAVGRALRQNPGDDKTSTIVVPVFMEPGQELEEGVKGTRYRLLYQVLIALSTYDEHVIHRVDWAISNDSEEDLGVAARPERADEIIPLLDLQATGAPNRVWQIGFESAQRYFDTYGHLDVPSRYLGPDRFYLGWWLGRQRSLRINRMLLPERIEQLDILGMVWPHPRSSIEYKLQIARDYKARHGHLAPHLEESFGGIRLGRWIADRRREANKRTLPYGYQRALNEIYPWWSTHWPKHWHHTYAQALTAARAGNLPFPDLRPDTDENLPHALARPTDRRSAHPPPRPARTPRRPPAAPPPGPAPAPPPRPCTMGLRQRTARSTCLLAQPPAPRRPLRLPLPRQRAAPRLLDRRQTPRPAPAHPGTTPRTRSPRLPLDPLTGTWPAIKPARGHAEPSPQLSLKTTRVACCARLPECSAVVIPAPWDGR